MEEGFCGHHFLSFSSFLSGREREHGKKRAGVWGHEGGERYLSEAPSGTPSGLCVAHLSKNSLLGSQTLDMPSYRLGRRGSWSLPSCLLFSHVG